MKRIASIARCLSGIFAAEFPLFCLLYFYFFLPVFFTYFLGHGYVVFLKYVLLQPFAWALALTLLGHCSKWMRWCIVSVCTLLFAGEVACLLCQSTRITSAMLIIVLQSNLSESTEFVVGGGNLWNIIAAFVCAAVVLALFIVADRYWKKQGPDLFCRFAGRYSSVLILAGCAACFAWSLHSNIYVVEKIYVHYWNSFNASALCAPTAYCIAVRDALSEASRINLDDIEKANDSAAAYCKDDRQLNIVLVIGESHIKHRSNLYGYFLPTNPRMSRYAACGQLLEFGNVVSFSNRTIDVFPQLLSTQHIGDSLPYDRYPLLPALMKKAGFKVVLYSNQSLVNTSKRFDFGCYYFLSRFSLLRQSFDAFNDSLYAYDGELVSAYPPLCGEGRNFTVYHLMGQHIDAAGRFPAAFAHFKPEMYAGLKQFVSAQPQCMADYDNACLYNDYVLDQIISHLKESVAIMIYVPDHGDENYDFRNNRGRDIMNITPGAVKTVYEVPMFIWMSDRFRMLYPDAVEMLGSNIDKPVFNTDISHTVLDLAHVSSDFYRPECSLLTDSVSCGHRILGEPPVFDYEANKMQIDDVKLIYDGL